MNVMFIGENNSNDPLNHEKKMGKLLIIWYGADFESFLFDCEEKVFFGFVQKKTARWPCTSRFLRRAIFRVCEEIFTSGWKFKIRWKFKNVAHSKNWLWILNLRTFYDGKIVINHHNTYLIFIIFCWPHNLQTCKKHAKKCVNLRQNSILGV